MSRLATGTVGLAVALSGGVFLPGVASAAVDTSPVTFDLQSQDLTYEVPVGACAVDWVAVGGFAGAAFGEDLGAAPGKVVATTPAVAGHVFRVGIGQPGTGAADSESTPEDGTASTVSDAGDAAEPFLVARGGGETGGENFVDPDRSSGPGVMQPAIEGGAEDGSVVIAQPVECVVLAPTELVATPSASTTGTVALTWKAGAGDGLAAESWEVSTSGVNGEYKPLPGVTGTADLSAELTGLAVGTYDIAVRAVAGGVSSDAVTAPVEVKAAPQDQQDGEQDDQPPVLEATSARAGEVDLTFTAATPTTEGWEVSTDGGVSWEDLANVVLDGDTNVLTATIKPLTPGHSYDIAVRNVVEGVPGAISNVKTVIVAAAVAVEPAPVLQAGSPRVGEVDLTFHVGEDGTPADSWEYSTDGGENWADLEAVAVDAQTGVGTATLTTLVQGSSYDVAVRTVIDGTSGESSNVVTVTVTKAVVKEPVDDEPVKEPVKEEPVKEPVKEEPVQQQPEVVVEKPVNTVPNNGGTPAGPSAPQAPSSVSVKADRSQVLVTWAAPTGGGAVDHYVVTLSPTTQTFVSKDASTFSARFGAAPGTTYTATVVAVSKDGLNGPAGSGVVTLAAADKPVVPASVPVTPLTLTTDKGQITKAEAGQKLTIVGTGFLPYSLATIIIYSEPTELGTVMTDGNGNFSKEVVVPASLAAGQHSLVASGVAPDGTARFMRMDVTVAPAAAAAGSGAAGGGLAYTGFEPAVPLTIGLGAVFLGGLALLVARRRRVTQD